MKLIIGVYDRELSHNLSVILSSKKITPIEAEAIEEIPALLELHPGAMLLCEEVSLEFYQLLRKKNIQTDIFLLYHPLLSSIELLKLRNNGIKALIPYSNDSHTIIEVIIKQLSLLASTLQKNDKSFIIPNKKQHKNVAIYLSNSQKWIASELVGFNSSKVSIKIDQFDIINAILKEYNSDTILMYLQGLNIKVYADLINHKENTFIFRYRNMSKDDAHRLAYYINYCQKYTDSEKIVVNV